MLEKNYQIHYISLYQREGETDHEGQRDVFSQDRNKFWISSNFAHVHVLAPRAYSRLRVLRLKRTNAGANAVAKLFQIQYLIIAKTHQR